jgi:hypothetical protein
VGVSQLIGKFNESEPKCQLEGVNTLKGDFSETLRGIAGQEGLTPENVSQGQIGENGTSL